jgi:phosphoribosylformylglycinamidine cyclo-ligase
MLPRDARLKLRLRLGSWEVPPIFALLAQGGRIADEEMRRTFNMGVGMLVCVPADRAAEATALCERAGERVFAAGEVLPADAPDAPVEFAPR